MTFSYEDVDRAERERRIEGLKAILPDFRTERQELADEVRDVACLVEDAQAISCELLKGIERLDDLADRLRRNLAEENLARSELAFLERRREREDPPCPL